MNMNKLAYAFAGILVFTSCDDSSLKVTKQSSKLLSAVEASEESEEELSSSLKDVQKEEAEREKKEREQLTRLSFDKLEHDYGTVKAEVDNIYYFTVKNTGKKPLIIEKVEASCGCTSPEKPEKPILPGKSDRIKVVFHPAAGQVGNQNKTVTVTSNTVNRLTLLKIKAFVVNE